MPGNKRIEFQCFEDIVTGLDEVIANYTMTSEDEERVEKAKKVLHYMAIASRNPMCGSSYYGDIFNGCVDIALGKDPR